MAPCLTTRIGFEIELLAPPGSSRLALAETLADEFGGAVRRVFHLDSEPSRVPGMAVFHHLTPAFEVLDRTGRSRCRLVDDVTLTADLDARAPALPGWWRVVGDDARLLRLVARHTDPAAPLASCLAPVAALFGVDVRRDGEFVVLDDEHGVSIAIAAPLSGDRHRPCEIVTPPLERDHEAQLERLLAPARRLGFGVPAEAAVHLHVDAAPLRDPVALRNLLRLVLPRQDLLRRLIGTNPRCRRLGTLPRELAAVVEDPDFDRAGWTGARRQLEPLGLTKYADLNLSHLVRPLPGRDTVEWRILPGAATVQPILHAAQLFEALVRRATASPPVVPGARGDDADGLLAEIGLTGWSTAAAHGAEA